MTISLAKNVVYLATLQLDREADVPLYKQLYNCLREAILRGQLVSGAQLPASRELATTLSISRNTVLNAIDQLIAEGYLETHVGSGTYVAANLPEDLLHAMALPASKRVLSSQRTLGRTGQVYQQVATETDSTGNVPNNPYKMFNLDSVDMDAFPLQIWSKLVEKYTHYLPRTEQGNVVAGYYPLREAITHYVTTARGVHCTPEQVLVVSGSQQALYMTAKLVLDAGDKYWMENPGYNGARFGLMTSGAMPVYVPIDENGMNIDSAQAMAPDARLAYVTPARQFPLGMTMSLERRIKLLSWAEHNDAWIIEDDYDSEYRYDSYPLSSLQGLDTHQRVIYIGTFSKVLMSGLRLAYVIVPPDLVGAFQILRAVIDRFTALPQQAALAEFINEGHFARHIRRTRKLYQEKRDCLLREIKQQIGNTLTVTGTDSGMHLMAWLPDGITDRQMQQALHNQGISAGALQNFSATDIKKHGISLGYTGVPLAQIPRGVTLLARALAEAQSAI